MEGEGREKQGEERLERNREGLNIKIVRKEKNIDTY